MRPVAIGQWRFEPTLWPSLVAGLFILMTLSLGEWQAGRAGEKQALQARIDALASGSVVAMPARPIEASEFAQRPVEVKGEFLADKTIFIDNRIYRMRPGYHVVTPLRISGGELNVVINRGWIAAGPRREVLPRVSTPAGEQIVRGIATLPLGHVYELGPDNVSGPVKQKLALDRLGVQWGIALQPVVILQTGDDINGLTRDWPRQDAGVNTHLAYALQWNVMAVVGLILWISLNLRKVNDTE